MSHVTGSTRPWVAAAIADNQRRVKPHRCQRCRRPILIGPDADDVAALARVNPTPISSRNEPFIVAAGLHTYSLVRGQLFARYPENRSTSSRNPIYAEHKCEGGKRW